MSYILQILVRAMVETVYLVGIIILIGLIFGILRDNSIKNFQRSFGFKAIMLTGIIGVPIHELSHGILAVIFGHKITKVKLFQKPDSTGTMGYVRHSYNPTNLYQQVGNFFIGVAPIFGGGISIIVLMYFMLPNAFKEYIIILKNSFNIATINSNILKEIIYSYFQLFTKIFSFSSFKEPLFYVFIIFAICIASHISLSMADIKGAARGLIVIYFILLFINVLGLRVNVVANYIITYNILITGILIVALFLSFFTFLISVISLVITNK